jgi:hypothetical protein
MHEADRTIIDQGHSRFGMPPTMGLTKELVDEIYRERMLRARLRSTRNSWPVRTYLNTLVA